MDECQAVKMSVEVDGIEEAMQKVEALREKIEEAKSLAADIASIEFKLHLKD